MFNQLSVKELTDSEAWAAIEKADKEKDIDDIKLVRPRLSFIIQ